MVLLYNSRLDKQWSKKLDNRWSGPYLINDLKESRGIYLLQELDGTMLEGVYPGEQLKRFFSRKGVEEEEVNVKVVILYLFRSISHYVGGYGIFLRFWFLFSDLALIHRCLLMSLKPR